MFDALIRALRTLVHRLASSNAADDSTIRLRASEERIRLATRSAGIGIFDYDVVNDRCVQSEETYAMLGVHGTERGRLANFIAIIVPSDRARVTAAIASAFDPNGAGLLDQEFRIRRVDTGDVRWVKQTSHTFFQGHGDLRRAVRATGVLMDITERKVREARDQFLLTFNDAMRSISDPAAIQITATRLLGEHLQTNRVVYLEVEGDEFVIRNSYTCGVAPFTGRGPVSMFGEGFLDAYRRGDVVVVNDVQHESVLRPDERHSFLAVDIAAFTAVTLLKDGEWVGAVCVEEAAARAWTPWEVELIRIVAERIWQAVERARAEAALEASEQKLRLGLTAAQLGTWRFDLETRAFEADSVSKSIHGFDPHQTIDTLEKALSTVHPDDLPLIEKMFRRTRTAQIPHRYEYRVVRADGETRWVTTYWVAQGATSSVIGVVADVTEHKRKEIVLRVRYREQGRTLRLLLENAAQGILAVDASGTIAMANRTCETMFGWDAGTLSGQPLDVLFASAIPDVHVSFFSVAADVRLGVPSAPPLEMAGRRKDGSTFPLEISLTQIATADGGHSLAFISDVTSRRQAEHELAESHAALQERTIELQDRTTELERRTVQLSRLASELTLAEQRTRGELAKMLHDGLQQVLFSASLKLAQLQDHRRRALIADPLMDEARAEVEEAMAAARTLSVELAPPDVIAARLVPAANWLAGWMRTKYGLIVRVTADPHVDVTAKDVRTLLFQSLREILFNVVKHAAVSYADVKLAAGPDDTLVITVADRGVGFDPAMLDDPQLDRDNAGFGILSIRERLTLLGGRLEVEAAAGRGAEFRLIAPRATVPPPAYAMVPAQRATAVSPNKSAPLRVLLVDDHPELLQAVRVVLGEHDEFAVIGEARNGMEAIAQARALRPDVVLMDISMPVMNGVDATQSIHAELPWIQILGLSTYEKTEDPHPIELAGAVGYFQKGVDMRRLIEHLRAIQSSAGQYSAR